MAENVEWWRRAVAGGRLEEGKKKTRPPFEREKGRPPLGREDARPSPGYSAKEGGSSLLEGGLGVGELELAPLEPSFWEV